MKNHLSEFAGTFGFVFIGCGAVVFATPFIGYLGIAMAFGFAYGAMASTFKDCHLNPAATLATAVSGQFRGKNVWFTALQTAGRILMQTAGACAAVFAVYYIYSGKTGYVYQGSPDANIVERYTLPAAFCLEAILTFLFLCVFLGNDGRTGRRAAACGIFLTAALLSSYPVTKGALNPARTTASALFHGKDALAQLPVFWGAALTAALFAGLLYRPYSKRGKERETETNAS